MMTRKRWILSAVILIVLLLLGYGAFWLNDSYQAMPEALAALNSDSRVNVKVTDQRLTFLPLGKEAKTGLIVYPGGKVDFRAYAPMAKAIASEGYTVVIVKMPFNLAILSKDKANEVIKDFSNVKNWAMGGHSLGGVIASWYAHDNPTRIKGLIFLASYPYKDISSTSIECLTLYGTKDGFVKDRNINGTKNMLPKSTKIDVIQGGNHSNFGYYGFQKGDGKAAITREDQERFAVSESVKLLKDIDR